MADIRLESAVSNELPLLDELLVVDDEADDDNWESSENSELLCRLEIDIHIHLGVGFLRAASSRIKTGCRVA